MTKKIKIPSEGNYAVGCMLLLITFCTVVVLFLSCNDSGNKGNDERDRVQKPDSVIVDSVDTIQRPIKK